ncbi:MAG: glycosyltransferase family 1 protein [candidate division Zixibacteria bacterium]|nr:glycosyltransferase family 1 protein [candidate division Zixibacteria bacterium]
MPKAHKTYRINASIPDELEALNELSYNLHWSWNHETVDLFRRLDRDLWEATYHNPVKMLGSIDQDKLARAAKDEGFMAYMNRVNDNLQQYLSRQTWFEEKYGKFDTPQIAYFSMEFGITECLPIYSGGLGILAGDHLKSASELGLPLVGIGLLYQQGYFQQYLNADGWQQETYPENDFYNIPITLQTDQDGKPILVEVQFPGRVVYCQIWRAQVGRVPLYLLDTNTFQNNFNDRKITYQLYGGDNETRIQQELILGIGGMLALRKLDVHVPVCHMNEGHAGFMAIERIRRRVNKNGLSTNEALEVVKSGTIFTTHTPVPAGIDIFSQDQIDKYLGHYFENIGANSKDYISIGQKYPGIRDEPFNMALMALRTTAYSNGVSRLHGEVSRKMWQSIWPNVPVDEIPIGHVTNGIHTRSWISNEMSELFLRYLGPNWLKNPDDQTIWERVDLIPDIELWRVHERRRDRLVAFTRKRQAEQLKRRGCGAKEVDLAREILSPDTLTIGFARRFATYKRATLLLSDLNRLKRLLTSREKPVQFIFAGKAHPRDNEGKELIKQLVHLSRDEELRRHIVFLENYDINVARYLVEGVDIWLNNPRRPMEASGTSGMKVVPNGGLNLSVIDGWWGEGYDTDTGWAIGAGEDYDDADYQDEIEGKAIYDVLESDIIPLFYDRGNDDLPRHWISKMKSSMIKLGPQFNTNRMVMDYTNDFYMKAYENWKKLSSDNFSKTKELDKWKQHIRNHWDEIEIKSTSEDKSTAEVGVAIKISAEIHLGALAHDDVIVQIYSGTLDTDQNITQAEINDMKYSETLDNGIYKFEGYIPCDESGLFGYSIRIMPHHLDMPDQFGLENMRWITNETQKPIIEKHEKAVELTEV